MKSSFQEASVPGCELSDSLEVCSRVKFSELLMGHGAGGCRLVSFLSYLEVFIRCVKSLNSVVVSVQRMMSLNSLEVSLFRGEVAELFGCHPSDPF